MVRSTVCFLLVSYAGTALGFDPCTYRGKKPRKEQYWEFAIDVTCRDGKPAVFSVFDIEGHELWRADLKDGKFHGKSGDERREGKIVSIARAADSISGRGSAVIEVENKDHKWRVGMIARVQVDLEPKMRMLVSSAALNITDQGTYVFVVENDAARKAPVKFALVDSDTVEILEGIEDGSAIVVAGGNFVTDKAAVKVVASEATDKKAH